MQLPTYCLKKETRGNYAFNFRESIDMMVNSNIKNILNFSADREEAFHYLVEKNGYALQSPSNIASPKNEPANPPLSFSQEQLWFLQQVVPDNPFYNEPVAIKLNQKIDLAILKNAFSEILKRHEVTRTRFDFNYGRPFQVIDDKIPELPVVIDLKTTKDSLSPEDIQWLIQKEAMIPFDLKKDIPIRVKLLLLNESESILILTMHHIASDAWSFKVLVNELNELCRAFEKGKKSPLPELPMQYRDYAIWQRRHLSDALLEKEIAYWARKLENIPNIHSLPLDRSRPRRQSFQGAQYKSKLSPATIYKLNALCKATGASLFMVLHAAFSAFIYRYGGENDIVLGTPVANRKTKEVEPLIGFFANVLILRLIIKKDFRFIDLIRKSQEEALNTFDRESIPFELLVNAIKPQRSMSHNPLFQIMFALNYEHKFEEGFLFNANKMDINFPVSKFDLTISFNEKSDQLNIVWEYATDIFKESSIKRMDVSFDVLLDNLLNYPERPIDTISLLTENEQKELLQDWSEPKSSNTDRKYLVL